MASLHIDRLLDTCIKQGASDLHLTVGKPPTLRMSGKLIELKTKTLEPADTTELMKAITADRSRASVSPSSASAATSPSSSGASPPSSWTSTTSGCRPSSRT